MQEASMTLGEKIRQLRRDQGMSQQVLSDKLGITSQAVSKWENGSSFPDISMLPSLASIFGVQIDDLFEYSRDKQLEKISNMIELKSNITNKEFTDAESFLLREIERNPEDHESNSMLADLYCTQAFMLNRKAVHYGKAALALEPNSKFDLNTINNSWGGMRYDWNVADHHELIDYLKHLLKDKPENKRAYFYLIDNLVDDGRIAEARRILAESVVKNPDNLNEAYEIWIEEKVSGFGSVKSRYEALAQKYPKDWRILFNIANSFSHNEHYEEAIGYWQMAFDAMEAPRFTDFHESIALCYIRLGNKARAIEAYKNEKALLRYEWNISFGRDQDRLDKKIRQLEETGD